VKTSNVPRQELCRDDEFGNDDDIYSNDGEDYADFLHLVQVLKSTYDTYTWVNDFGPHADYF